MARASEVLQCKSGEVVNAVIAQRLGTVKRITEAYGESDPNTEQPRKILRLGKFTADAIESSPDDPPDTYTVVVDEFSTGSENNNEPVVLAEVFLNPLGNVWGHVLSRAIDPKTHMVHEPKPVRRGSAAAFAGFFPKEFGGTFSPGQRAKAQDALLSWTEEMVAVFSAYEEEMEANNRSTNENECVAVVKRFDRIAQIVSERVANQKFVKMPEMFSQRVGENPNARGNMKNDTLIVVTPGQTFAEDPSDFLNVDICQYHENARSVIVHYDRLTGLVTHTIFTESYVKDAIRAPLSDFPDERRRNVLRILDEVIVGLDGLSEPVVSPPADLESHRRPYKNARP